MNEMKKAIKERDFETFAYLTMKVNDIICHCDMPRIPRIFFPLPEGVLVSPQ